MKNSIRSAATVLLSILIVLSSLTAIFSYFVKATILSEDFYLGIVATPTYLSMVKEAINTQFQAQSSYVAIPEEVFASTLDDAALHLMLRKHIASATAYLNGLAAFEKPVYPQELLTGPLYAYLEQQSSLEGTVPTQNQYDLVTQVAVDSGTIIQNQICLIDLDLVKDRGAFQSAHQTILTLKDGFVPSVLLLFAACVLLVLLNRKVWRTWLNGILVSFWIVGTLLMVPTLVLQNSGLTRRLSIETGYLKYFVDSVLTDMNLYFLLWGVLLFTVTSAAMCVLKWTYHAPRKKSDHILHRVNVNVNVNI